MGEDLSNEIVECRELRNSSGACQPLLSRHSTRRQLTALQELERLTYVAHGITCGTTTNCTNRNWQNQTLSRHAFPILDPTMLLPKLRALFSPKRHCMWEKSDGDSRFCQTGTTWIESLRLFCTMHPRLGNPRIPLNTIWLHRNYSITYHYRTSC